MNRLTDIIKEKYIIRHTKKQKADFREFIVTELSEDGISAQVQSGRQSGIPVHNIIIGNADTAEYLITAHYDTPNTFLLPIVMFADSFTLSLISQLIVFVPLVFLSVIAGIFSGPAASLLVFYGGMFLGMFAFTNKNNFNDNTSGVLTVLEILYSLTDEERKKCAFVLFDNEEKGLLGSAYLNRTLKNRKIPVLNFDCVGDGDEIRMFYKKDAQDISREISGLFDCNGSKTVKSKRRSVRNILYMSDDYNFPSGICFAAFRSSALGKYISRIHTNRDTICSEENISFIASAVTKFIRNK